MHVRSREKVQAMKPRLGEFLDDTILRLPWADAEALPHPGRTLTIDALSDGKAVAARVRVVDALRDWEPGWIQISSSPPRSANGGVGRGTGRQRSAATCVVVPTRDRY